MAAVSTPPVLRPLAIKITCGAEAAERANQAWTVAATAIASGADVAVWLVARRPVRCPRSAARARPRARDPVADLIETVRLAGRIVVCTMRRRRDLARPT
jgi:predicted peroxiredoxin